MDRKVYFEKLFSDRREKLIDKCIELHRKGKRFLYIMPSSAAIFQVRNRLIKANRGFLGSGVIVFDDLEMNIIKDSISMNSIIYEPIDRVIVADICNRLKDKLMYYGNIYDKKGLHQEITTFIRTVKRSCIDEDNLVEAKDKINDEVLEDKLQDLHLIYKEYNDILRGNGIYDRNDISLRAIDLIDKYEEFNEIDTIVIDGFTDIEKVSMKLIEKLAELNKSNIYINCPYENNFMKDFLEEEIVNPFRAMGFEILQENEDKYKVDGWINELGNKFYSGQKISAKSEQLKITKYPCIEAEIRETARSIKERLISGEAPEEITIYLNNKDDYSECMLSVFKEFGIPLSMAYELPLGDSELIRKTLKEFETREEEMLAGDKWISLLKDEIEGKKEYILELVRKALNEELSFADKLELKSFDALGRLLDEIRESLDKSSMLQEEMSGEHFVEFILEGAASTNITIEQGNNSGIRVMDTALAKGVYYNHVYILGLNEGELPSVVKNNGLFDSYEVLALKSQGIKYRDFMWELTREKIRFNLALTSAKESITLSFRGANEEGGFAIASPFIDEIKYLCDIKKIDELSMRDRFDLTYDKVMSSFELKSHYINNYFGSKYKQQENDELESQITIVNNYSIDTEEVLRNGEIEYHREEENTFNEYEGIMQKDFAEIADTICKFSPSAINTYLKCPFKYLVSCLYKPGEQEDEEEEFSNLEIGDFYHKVLYGYYKNVNQYLEFDQKVFDKVFEESYSKLRTLDISEDDKSRERDNLYETLRTFTILDVERLQKFNEKSGNLLKPVLLECELEDKKIFGVKIKCKVDRVDAEYKFMDDELVPTGRYIIYDYKKKSINGVNNILENEDYQLVIYNCLIQNRLKEVLGQEKLECMALLYLSIEKSAEKIELDGLYKTEYKNVLDIKKKGDIISDNFTLVLEYIKGLIDETIGFIKSGRFNYKTMCSSFDGYKAYSCEYEKLCRYSKNKIKVLVGEQL